MNLHLHFLLIILWIILNPFITSAQSGPTSETISPSMSWDDLSVHWEKLALEGKIMESIPWARAALEKARVDSGETSLAYGSTLDFLGYSLHHSGNYLEAEQCFLNALQHAEKYLGREDEDYISRLSNLAMLHKDMGKLSVSLAELEECVAVAEKIMTEDNPSLGIMVNNLGIACNDLGYLDTALKHYLRALDLTGKTFGTDHVKYAIRLGNIAAVYRDIGQPSKALEYAQQALLIHEKKNGKESISYIIGAYQVAAAQLWCRQFTASLKTMEEVLDLCARINFPESTQLYDIKTFACTVYKHNKLYEKSIATGVETYETYIRLFPFLHYRHAKITGNIMQAYAEYGKTAEAGNYAIKSMRFYLEEMKGSFSESDQMNAYNAIRRNDQMILLRFSINHPEITGLSDVIYDYTMGMKGLTLSSRKHIFHSFKASKKPQLSEQFEEWMMLQQTINRQYALRPALRQPNLDSLEGAAGHLERLLAQSSETFRQSRLSFTWKNVQAYLKPGEAAIEFNSVYLEPGKPATCIARVVLPDREHPVPVILFNEAEAGDLKAVRSLYSFETQPDRKTLRELVWLPLEPLLRNVHTIYYAPDGIIHNINPGAIPIAPGQILADKCQLHRLINTSAIELLKTEPEVSKPIHALIMGGIKYESDSVALSLTNDLQTDMMPARTLLQERGLGGSDEWSFLPGTLEEAQNTSKKLQQAGTKVRFADGFMASEGYFKKNISTQPADLLHLATHGFFFSEADTTAASGFQASTNPLARTGLILAGANRVWKGEKPLDGQEDGILTGLEISHLDLSETELVVLSACGTGQGTVENGEGIIGLQRAFKIAGARYIIMTLWNVDDRQTSEFMNLFYTNWITNGKPVPEAFREAQQQMRLNYSKPFQPAAWAPFILLE